MTVTIFPAWQSCTRGASQVLRTLPKGQQAYLLAPGCPDQRPDQHDLQERGHRPANIQVAPPGFSEPL
jgi:hypothetical protein